MFDLPTEKILPVREVEVRLDDAAHPFELENAREIECNWQREMAANPALFDGRVALLSSLGLDGGVLAGHCHIVRYATFLLWRRRRPVGGAGHAYTHPVLVGSDNALLAIRMGPDTVNAGAVYFAAGSFEAVDFRDGKADLEFNMRREVLEETGIDIAGRRHEPGYHVLSKATGAVLFRRYFLDRTADELAEQVRAHVAGEDRPEIEGPVVIRHGEDEPEGLASQMPDLIRWHFSMPRHE